jgi:putative transcriptional regulator
MQPTLLIASPQSRDPFFERTVVLVWHHDQEGAIGVVVNRHLKHQLNDVLDVDRTMSLDDLGDVAVVWGGPVESGSGTVVTVGRISKDEGWVLPSGLGVTQSQDVLIRLLKDRAPLMLCLGYAGWGPGQLDREIELGGWLWTDCDASIVFDTPPEERYDRALASLGLTANSVWMQPINE